MRLVLFVVLLTITNSALALACSPARYDNVEEYVETLMSAEYLAFVGGAVVKEKTEIDRFVFYQFEVFDDFLGNFSDTDHKFFVGYTHRMTPDTTRISSCDSYRNFEIGSEHFLTLFGQGAEPYSISALSTHLAGFQPNAVKKEIRKQIKNKQ